MGTTRLAEVEGLKRRIEWGSRFVSHANYIFNEERTLKSIPVYTLVNGTAAIFSPPASPPAVPPAMPARDTNPWAKTPAPPAGPDPTLEPASPGDQHCGLPFSGCTSLLFHLYVIIHNFQITLEK